MACRYYYKGHQFDSELALDDFLLEKLPFEPSLGDMVFSDYSSIQLSKVLKIEELGKKSTEVKEAWRDAKLKGKIVIDDNGEETLDNPPYIGVTKFLSHLRNSDGKFLYPEFRRDSYWALRADYWKKGDFTNEELDELGIKREDAYKIIDTEELKKLEESMEARWADLANIGTRLHKIVEICFLKTDGKYNFTLSDSELIKLISKESKEKESIIKHGIEYARSVDRQLRGKLGDNLIYYPEFNIMQEAIQNNETINLMGVIDLLIIDKDGGIHILDYKTSTHNYGDYSNVKKQAYNYLLAVYQRMLQRSGIETYRGRVFIAPILLYNFRKEGKTHVYDDIGGEDIRELLIYSNGDNFWNNIDEILPATHNLLVTTENAASTASEMMAKWFPEFNTERGWTEERVIKMLKNTKRLVPDEKGQYRFLKNDKSTIKAYSESEFVTKVFNYLKELPSRRIRETGAIKTLLQTAIDEMDVKAGEFQGPRYAKNKASSSYLEDLLAPYCNGSWEIYSSDLLEAFGIILLKTRDGVSPLQIDVIRISTNDLMSNLRKYLDESDPRKNRKNLTGNFEYDVTEKSKSNSLMLEAIVGNVELMETMLLINLMDGLEGKTIGNVKIINPAQGVGMAPSNEELAYCWAALNKYEAVKNDRFKDGSIKFADKCSLLRTSFNNLMSEAITNNYSGDYNFLHDFKGCTPLWDDNIDISSEEKVKTLVDMDRKLLNIMRDRGGVLDKTSFTTEELKSKAVILHNDILMAISQLKGVNFRLQLHDHDYISLTFNPLKILTEGSTGTYTSNPGNLENESLNLISKLLYQSYQNVRDQLLEEKIKITKLIDNLKKLHNLGKFAENTYANQVNLYKDMFETNEVGDLLFKNPDRLEGADKEFLEYALYKINKNRYPNYTDEQLERMRNSDDIEYYRVPLSRGKEDSKMSAMGFVDWFKGKLRCMDPRVIANKLNKRYLNPDIDDEDNQYSLILFRSSTTFDKGEDSELRLNIIKETGIENFEHNVELLLYKHLNAYAIKDALDDIFPMLKATLMHMATQGSILGTPFEHDLHYYEMFIKNKVFNKSIINNNLRGLSKLTGDLRNAASVFTLAFSPVQALYLPLQGIWDSIRLIITKPDGTLAFTLNHFRKAFKIAYSDLFHYSGTPTLCSAFNELYALNDMDINSYDERISTAKKGIWNFLNFALKCTTRPDYYNRSIIFLCQMMGDGCLDAHHLNSDGKLIYDWTKDKRFDAFAIGNKSDPRYNTLRALYYEIAKLFEIEHVKNADGTDFVLNMTKPMALPRAYSSKLVENYKSVADNIYGYYPHEKKSLMMATTLGSMWMLFKNFWSGKRDQWLRPGGVYLKGNWEQLEVNGIKLFYLIDKESGEVLWNERFTELDTGIPVYKWSGRWEEGILVTLSSLAKDWYNLKSFKKAWNNKWNNEDDKLKLTYQANLKLFGYDIFMLALSGVFVSAIMGTWVENLKRKNEKNKDFEIGLQVTAANVAYFSLKTSLLDFNPWEDVFNPMVNPNFFAVNWTGRLAKNFWNVATGKEDFWDGIVKISSAARYVKPALDTLKPDCFRTEREGGTFNKKSN